MAVVNVREDRVRVFHPCHFDFIQRARGQLGVQLQKAQHVIFEAPRGIVRTGAGVNDEGPFIIHTGTSPDYATRRFKDHMLRFLKLHAQLTSGTLDEVEVARMEYTDPVFPHVDYRHWQ